MPRTPNKDDALKYTVHAALETIDEIRPQMPEPPATAYERIRRLVDGQHSLKFGNEPVAIEMALAVGYINGLAHARGQTVGELLAQFGAP